MPYTVLQAKTHLSRLLKEAEAGQEVVLLRGKKPVAKIVPIHESSADSPPFRLIGAYRDLIQFEDSAFDPATDAELVEMGFDYLLDGELVPPSSPK